ncbi:hypothetical protein F3Y22_tig00112957pilonHSYRG00049 [Hibiscus syriacus]|uniref:Uncharacterized protein n=2 Tax=Hibiscus syriacus TaxID=106335 RepID=A0A6A2X419_HIBSY|nr:hypothetical protein F3Y22_tig00112957pilonHSYRG00049 [Hibiscus syriacus]
MSSEKLEGYSAFLTAEISDLQEMHTRLKAVEKAVVEEMNRLVKQESNRNRHEIKAPSYGIEPPNQETKKGMQVGDELARNLKSKKPKIPETRNGILLKDIPLDQVSDSSLYRSKSKRETCTADDQTLELWESAEHECDVDLKLNDMQEQAIVPGEIIASHQLNDVESKTDCSLGALVEKELSIDKLEISTSNREPKKRAKSRRFLDRLDSDAHKLTTLQTTVKQLKKRMEIKKRKKDFELEYGQVKEQLQEVEDAITELLNANGELVKDVKGCCSSSFDGTTSTELEEPRDRDLKKVREQAQKGSEKIGRLQFEVQSIEYVLLKLEDERKSKGKNRMGVVHLRDFIYSGGRRSGRRKKACFCGCARPSRGVD